MHSDVLRNDFFELIDGVAPDVYHFFTDLKTGIVRWSQNVVSDFDMPEYCSAENNNWADHVHPDEVDGYKADLDRIFSGKSDYHSYEYRAKNADGEYVWLRCSGVVSYDEDGNRSMFGGIMIRLDVRNTYDPVTGLRLIGSDQPVKAKLKDEVNGIYYILFGFDRFSSIVNKYGQAFADMLLKQFGEKCVSYLRNMEPPKCHITRFIKDEFILIIRGRTEEEISKIFKDIQNLGRDLEAYNHTVSVNMTGAMVKYPDDGADSETLMFNAEQALAFAKNNERGQLVRFTDEVLEDQVKRMELRERLENSVGKGFEDFEVFYMPLVNKVNKRMEACEALLRYRRPKGSANEFYGTDDVIRELEESGLIRSVGRWVIDTVLSQAKAWQDEGLMFETCINVSIMQLREPEFAEYIINKVEELNINPDYITIELTESIKIQNLKLACNRLKKLKDAGLNISLDDFGTGYSTLTMLQQLPVDYVKIDQSFVRKLTDSNIKDRAIVNSIISLCNNIDIGVVVEGVETKELADTLSLASVTYLQGWFFSKPCRLEEFTEHIFKVYE